MAAAFLTAFLASFFNRNGNDGDRLDGHIHAACLHSSNLVDNIQTFGHLAEHGVVAIEMRRTTHGLVGLTLSGREHLAHAAFKHVQSLVVVHLALHNVEL